MMPIGLDEFLQNTLEKYGETVHAACQEIINEENLDDGFSDSALLGAALFRAHGNSFQESMALNALPFNSHPMPDNSSNESD